MGRLVRFRRTTAQHDVHVAAFSHRGQRTALYATAYRTLLYAEGNSHLGHGQASLCAWFAVWFVVRTTRFACVVLSHGSILYPYPHPRCRSAGTLARLARCLGILCVGGGFLASPKSVAPPPVLCTWLISPQLTPRPRSRLCFEARSGVLASPLRDIFGCPQPRPPR